MPIILQQQSDVETSRANQDGTSATAAANHRNRVSLTGIDPDVVALLARCPEHDAILRTFPEAQYFTGIEIGVDPLQQRFIQREIFTEAVHVVIKEIHVFWSASVIRVIGFR